MSLLDNMKDKAVQNPATEELDESTIARRDRNWLVMKPKMILLISYFREFSELSNQIHPSKCFDFQITKNFKLKGFKKTAFKFDVPKDDGSEGCTLRYNLVQDNDIKIVIRNRTEAQAVQDTLKSKGIQFISKEDQNNHIYFKIMPKITTRFAFSADLDAGTFAVLINNYDGGWNQTIHFKPAKVREQFLDELGKYILGEENDFMEITGNRVAETTRKSLQAALKANNDHKEKPIKNTKKKQRISGLLSFFKK